MEMMAFALLGLGTRIILLNMKISEIYRRRKYTHQLPLLSSQRIRVDTDIVQYPQKQTGAYFFSGVNRYDGRSSVRVAVFCMASFLADEKKTSFF